jgi:prolyl-tRNA synthetase
MALIRGDKSFEETQVLNAIGAVEIRSASPAELEDIFGAGKGFIGPKDLKEIQVIADNTLKDLKNFVAGANEADKHYTGVNWGKDVPEPEFADIRLVEKDELCPVCHEPLHVTRGIEVGNIFQLGTKYSAKMNAVFTDEGGTEKPFVMGCYGIGISRTAAAAVERYYDEFGIKWPVAIAPYHAIVVPVNINDEKQAKIADEIYEKLLANGVETVIDDRDERAGVKFKDADLIGFPFRITAGKTVEEGLVEFKIRETGETVKIPPDEAVERVISAISKAD